MKLLLRNSESIEIDALEEAVNNGEIDAIQIDNYSVIILFENGSRLVINPICMDNKSALECILEE